MLDECKITEYYCCELNRLYNEYEKDIAFVGVFPNFTSKPSKIESFKNKHSLEFPLKTDYYKSLAKKFNAKVMPEVVVYNETKNIIIYQGRIDDAYVRVGKKKRVIQERDLEIVLKSIVNKTSITPYKTEAVGCFINFREDLSGKSKS